MLSFFTLTAMCMVRDICKFPLEHYKTIFKRLFPATSEPPRHTIYWRMVSLAIYTIKMLLSEKKALYPLEKEELFICKK